MGTPRCFQANLETQTLDCVLGLPQWLLPVGHAGNIAPRRGLCQMPEPLPLVALLRVPIEWLISSPYLWHWVQTPFEGRSFLPVLSPISFFWSLRPACKSIALPSLRYSIPVTKMPHQSAFQFHSDPEWACTLFQLRISLGGAKSFAMRAQQKDT